MRLKCQKTQRLLSDYIDATLPERQMTNIASHLDTCRTCRREAINLKKTCHLLENFYVEPAASDAYYARFTQTLQQRIQQKPPPAVHERARGIGAQLTWQALTQVCRYIDRCIPNGFIIVRQKMLPYYALAATMMTLLVAPLVFVPTGENGEHPLGPLYTVATARLFSTSTPVSHQPAATLAIQQDQATTQPAEIRQNVSRSRTTETPTVDSGTDVWQFTDEPLAEGYILATLRKNSKETFSSLALDIDSELLAYAELPSQGTRWEHPRAREVLTDGRYAVLLLKGIRSGQHALQEYKRKWSQFEGFSRQLLDVPLETLSITEVYDSMEL